MSQQAARQPSPWIRVLAAAGAATLIGASIVLSTTPASAKGLEAFDSCDDLRAHLETAARDVGFGGEDDMGGGGAESRTSFEQVGAPLAPTGGDAAAAQDGGGGTNTQVEGIDELDIVEVLGDGRILAARNDRIVLIDAAGERIVATLEIAGPPQVTFDDERGTLWAVSSDGLTTILTRSHLDGSTFTGTSTWTVEGRLVDLRRNGEQVHLVAVDDDIQHFEGDLGTPEAGSAVPFGDTSPVPCDQVLHSPLPGGPATTLVASFSATGDLAPLAATEIVGAGDNVLVTDTALYVSTPSFDDERLVTGIHRFELDELRLTGSGSVEGRLLNQFSLDEHDGHLRAAITIGDGGFIGRPMPVEGDGGIGVAEPTDADSTGGADPEEGEVPPDSAVVDEPVPEPLPAPIEEPSPAPTDPLNEIVTFDLDGALDIVGRSARFGHEGETLHGIRFAGDIAYAVTFLQTDPLYVIDLSEPAFPRVLGEIEIPGFSAYLHPISDTQVVGFGPDGEGRTVARLFDISDPTAPQLLDTVTIAADSPITYDHHALRTDGDRLVIAANDYVSRRPDRCGPVAADQAELDDLYRQLEEQYRTLEGEKAEEIPPAIRALEERIGPLSECVYPGAFPQARIVTLTPAGASLGIASIETSASDAQRVLPLGDGYLIVGTEITRVGSNGATQAVLG